MLAREIQVNHAVLDASAKGIAGARILTAEGLPIATADENGRFAARIRRGAVIQVQAEGFLSLLVHVSQIMDGRILLRAAPARKPFERTVRFTANYSPQPFAARAAWVPVLSTAEVETVSAMATSPR